MSTAVLILPVGAKFATRSPVFSTTKQEAISGKETCVSLQSFPRWKWDLDVECLRSSPAFSATEFQYLVGFFLARQGSFDTFLYQDPDDNSVIGQNIGTGNGTTAAYPLVRTFGGFIEPMLAPNSVSAVYLAGVSIPSAGYSAPGAPALGSSAGGSLGATTYWVLVTWLTNSGETVGSGELSLAVGANNVLTVGRPSSPPAGAVSWRIYVSNTAGGGAAHETLQVTLAIATTTWTEPTSGLISGAAYTNANTTGWSVSNWGTSSPGVITFQGAPANAIAITADFTYYWPCRFQKDSFTFELAFKQLYKLKGLSWISCKN